MTGRRFSRRFAALLLVAVLALCACGLAQAEIAQRDRVRVVFSGSLTPSTLPRSQAVPVAVTMGGSIVTIGRQSPPQLRRITIAINRFGRLDGAGLPACRVEQIQPATTEGALQSCRASLVGEGRFEAKVLLPEQSPFPSSGKVYAFNGTYKGRPAILAHVYGVEPAPTSFTLPFQITHAKGTFGTKLTTFLPTVTSEWGYVTGLSLNLDRTFSLHGRRRGYVSASCPALAGFPGGIFPLARTTFAFAGGVSLTGTLNRSCRVRG